MKPRLRYGTFRDLAHNAILKGKLIPLLTIRTQPGARDDIREVLQAIDREYHTSSLDRLAAIRVDADMIGGGSAISPKLFFALLVHYGVLVSPEIWVGSLVAEIYQIVGSPA